jgi:organic hydroperoxide reductase OsmC/OhrA
VEEKKTYRTFQFENKTVWTSGRRGLLSAAEHATLEIGSPPAFKGDPDVWCPEDLLIGGLNTCLMLTFLTMAQRRNLRVVAYESQAQGVVEHAGGKYRVTNIKVEPLVSLGEPVNQEITREVVRDTLAACIITNSLSGSVEFVPQFRSGQ